MEIVTTVITTMGIIMMGIFTMGIVTMGIYPVGIGIMTTFWTSYRATFFNQEAMFFCCNW